MAIKVDHRAKGSFQEGLVIRDGPLRFTFPMTPTFAAPSPPAPPDECCADEPGQTLADALAELKDFYDRWYGSANRSTVGDYYQWDSPPCGVPATQVPTEAWLATVSEPEALCGPLPPIMEVFNTMRHATETMADPDRHLRVRPSGVLPICDLPEPFSIRWTPTRLCQPPPEPGFGSVGPDPCNFISFPQSQRVEGHRVGSGEKLCLYHYQELLATILDIKDRGVVVVTLDIRANAAGVGCTGQTGRVCAELERTNYSQVGGCCTTSSQGDCCFNGANAFGNPNAPCNKDLVTSAIADYKIWTWTKPWCHETERCEFACPDFGCTQVNDCVQFPISGNGPDNCYAAGRHIRDEFTGPLSNHCSAGTFYTEPCGGSWLRTEKVHPHYYTGPFNVQTENCTGQCDRARGSERTFSGENQVWYGRFAANWQIGIGDEGGHFSQCDSTSAIFDSMYAATLPHDCENHSLSIDTGCVTCEGCVPSGKSQKQQVVYTASLTLQRSSPWPCDANCQHSNTCPGQAGTPAFAYAAALPANAPIDYLKYREPNGSGYDIIHRVIVDFRFPQDCPDAGLVNGVAIDARLGNPTMTYQTATIEPDEPPDPDCPGQTFEESERLTCLYAYGELGP